MSLINQIKNVNSSKKELRKFGICFGIALAVIGSIHLWKGNANFKVFYIISGISILLGVICPVALKPVQKILASLFLIAQHVVMQAALLLAFYLIFTPIGFVARLCGKSFLDEKIDKTKETYWIKREKRDFNPAVYEQQF